MKKGIIVLAVGLAVLLSVKAWAVITSNVNYNGADFTSAVTSNTSNGVFTFSGTVPVSGGASVRQISINFPGNQMTVTTNAS